MAKKVFLGGTCNGSLWREKLIPELKIDYFNPVVDKWSDAAYEKELQERKDCDYCLYVITPKATGFYSIAEIADDSNKRPDKTIYCILENDDESGFTAHQLKSLKKVGQMVRNNGGTWCENFDQLAALLNRNTLEVPA